MLFDKILLINLDYHMNKLSGIVLKSVNINLDEKTFFKSMGNFFQPVIISALKYFVNIPKASII